MDRNCPVLAGTVGGRITLWHNRTPETIGAVQSDRSVIRCRSFATSAMIDAATAPLAACLQGSQVPADSEAVVQYEVGEDVGPIGERP